MIDDLESSGLLQSTMIVMWGEFGRTPRVNPKAGRDHWAGAASALVTGGGLKMGQVIGSTNRYAETAQDRPVHIQEMFATFYQQLGIDPKKTHHPRSKRPAAISDGSPRSGRRAAGVISRGGRESFPVRHERMWQLVSPGGGLEKTPDPLSTALHFASASTADIAGSTRLSSCRASAPAPLAIPAPG